VSSANFRILSVVCIGRKSAAVTRYAAVAVFLYVLIIMLLSCCEVELMRLVSVLCYTVLHTLFVMLYVVVYEHIF